MRRRTIAPLGCPRVAVGALTLTGACAQQRGITTRGQFNPVHNFSYGMERGVRAKDEKSFEKLITNPGPLRVAYTPDYLDWLYRCYRAKGKYMDARAAAEKKFSGNLISSQAAGTAASGDLQERLPGRSSVATSSVVKRREPRRRAICRSGCPVPHHRECFCGRRTRSAASLAKGGVGARSRHLTRWPKHRECSISLSGNRNSR
ncbi:hypothetical protein DQ04_00611050 [Trypanosoma grayi]|uniref:hypothetical protein n=1 Tax=Trypanosoma grayi TaxID=71804 RepID=UPI0004F4BD39|nr:hypothetical protein DQ04_00611050 [Trypanosoma grayi]KEG14118.1 hypothetical protein DQ04_00611050 [Trypanosoma grayi]